MAGSLSEKFLLEVRKHRALDISEEQFQSRFDSQYKYVDRLSEITFFALSRLPRTEIYMLPYDLSKKFSYDDFNPWENLQYSERWCKPWILRIEGNSGVPEVIVTHVTVVLAGKTMDIFTEYCLDSEKELANSAQFGYCFEEKRQYLFFEDGNPLFRNNLFFLANLFLAIEKQTENFILKNVNEKQKPKNPSNYDDTRPRRVYLSLSKKGHVFYTEQRKKISEKRNLEEMLKVEVTVEGYYRRKDATKEPTPDNLIWIDKFPSHRYINKRDKEIVIKP